MALNLAIDYDRNWYSKDGKILGARVASEGFLRALLQHVPWESCVGFAEGEANSTAFLEQVRGLQPLGNYRTIPIERMQELTNCDVLYRGDPRLADRAFQRRTVGESEFSLCGITHTICSGNALRALAELWTAPLHPWDALVCTSQSARKVVLEQGAAQAEYFAEQGGKLPPRRFELPVIPLGVDVPYFAQHAQDPLRRKTQRAALGISPEAVCFLYFGRLSMHAKANPLPMYQALEMAARQTGKQVHLIQAGWFASPSLENAFRRGAEEFAPHVRVSYVDGGRSDVHHVWAAADVFISLVDNIQETFGITPLEAMAAGVPVIASDWDGYRETVRHEIDGLLIPTYTPPAGAGADFAFRHFAEVDNYDFYIAGVSQSTAVDTNAAAAACIRLLEDPVLRRTLGQRGQAQARQYYDWPVVINAYVDLWNELKRRRQAAPPIPQAKLPVPWFADPFQTFAHYPTQQFSEGTYFSATPWGVEVSHDTLRIEKLFANVLLLYVKTPAFLLARAEVVQLLATLANEAKPAAELLCLFPQQPQARVWRTLGWLVKLNLLAVVGDGTGRR